MHNTCVKYVNKQRFTTSISSVLLSTSWLRYIIQTTTTCLQSLQLTNLTTFLSSTFSTYKNQKSYLLDKSFTHNPHSLLIELIIEN